MIPAAARALRCAAPPRHPARRLPGRAGQQLARHGAALTWPRRSTMRFFWRSRKRRWAMRFFSLLLASVPPAGASSPLPLFAPPTLGRGCLRHQDPRQPAIDACGGSPRPGPAAGPLTPH